MAYKILLDTNILIDSFRFKVRLADELNRISDFPFELYTIKGVIEELERLINDGGSKEKRSAKLALDFIRLNAKILDMRGKVDDIIVKLGKKGYVPCTSDKELKKRLKDSKFIILKQRKYLSFENVLP